MRKLLNWYRYLTLKLRVIIFFVFAIAAFSALIEFYLLSNVGALLTSTIGGGKEKLLLNDGIKLFIVIWVAAFVRIGNVFMVGYSASASSTDIIKRLFNNMSKHPFYVGKIGKSEFNAAFNEQASDLTWQCIRPTISIINDCIVSFGLIVAVISVDINSFLLVAIALSFAYLILLKFIKSRQIMLSKNINKLQISVSSESSNHFNNLFLFVSPTSSQLVKDGLYKSISSLRKNQFLGQFYTIFPKYLIETLGFSLLLLMLTIPSSQSSPLVNTGVIAVGAQRLLPIFQQMYAAYSSVTNSKELISKIDIRLRNNPIYNEQKIFYTQSNVLSLGSLCISQDHIDFLKFSEVNIESRSINCIVGRSGSGKSTLLRSIIGLEQISSGEIKINDITVSSYNVSPLEFDDFVRNVSYVPQDSPCIKGTIYKNLTLSDNCSDEDLITCQDYLKKVGLLDDCFNYNLFNREISDDKKLLSGGQQKRLAIARALMQKPKVLILDEPTAGLDEDNTRLIAKAIRQLADTIVVIATHDKLFLESLSPNVNLINLK